MTDPRRPERNCLAGLSIDKSDASPAYLRIAAAIKERLSSGRLPPGAALPPERVLAIQFGVSRMTMRQANDLLEREGLIVRQSGRGTFAAARRIEKRQQEMRSFTEEIIARGAKPSSRLLSFRAVHPSGAAKEFFSLPPGQMLYAIERVRLSDGVPIALELTQIPCYLCPNLDRFNLLEHSLYKILEEHYGIQLAYCEEEIAAERPDRNRRRLLELPASAALLVVRRKTFSENDTAIELGVTAYRSDIYTAVVRSVRPAGNGR